jgi:hypothetical protein
MPFFVFGTGLGIQTESSDKEKKKIFPAEKRTVVFRRKLKFFAKNVVNLNFALVFHYYIYFTVVYPCKKVVLPSWFFPKFKQLQFFINCR